MGMLFNIEFNVNLLCLQCAYEDDYLLGGEVKEYLKAIYLKSLREAENELIAKRNSSLWQILLGNKIFKGKEDTNELVYFFDLKTGLEKYFKGKFSNQYSYKKREYQTFKLQCMSSN